MHIFDLKEHNLITGRGATAIYLLLKTHRLNGKHVYVPANICYAAVYPILYAGYTPVFLDVDIETGNLDVDSIREIVCMDKEAGAVIVAHMFGNPNRWIEEIAGICHSHNILLIEDCASAMGAAVSGKNVGTFGDYVIYSTGYSKTIDVGYGGILSSSEPLDNETALNDSLPIYSKNVDADENFFSKIYRLIRNSSGQSISPWIFRGIQNHLQHMFLFRLSEVQINQIESKIRELPGVILQRRKCLEQYREKLGCPEHVKPFNYEEGAVPWRFNIFVDRNMRRPLIDALLAKHLPVSDWYPSVAPIFGNTETFPNTEYFSDRILNFPIPLTEKEINDICIAIKVFCASHA